MMSEFVGRSKLMRTSPSKSRFSRPVFVPPAGVGVGVGAGVAAPPRVRARPPAAPATATPVTAPSVAASSSQLAFSQ